MLQSNKREEGTAQTLNILCVFNNSLTIEMFRFRTLVRSFSSLTQIKFKEKYRFLLSFSTLERSQYKLIFFSLSNNVLMHFEVTCCECGGSFSWRNATWIYCSSLPLSSIPSSSLLTHTKTNFKAFLDNARQLNGKVQSLIRIKATLIHDGHFTHRKKKTAPRSRMFMTRLSQ